MRILTNTRSPAVSSDSSPSSVDPDAISPPPRYASPERPWVQTTPSAAFSEGTGRKIQKHLDDGNPIYIGVDPESIPHTRIPLSCQGGSTAAEQGSGSSDRDDGLSGAMLRGGETRSSSRLSQLAKRRCGWLKLDSIAKGTLSIGLFLALYQLQLGLQGFINISHTSDHSFYTILSALQLIWGILFLSSCLFGQLLLWGHWRRSPPIALLFTILWTCTTCLILVVAGIYLYLFVTVRNSVIMGCRNQTVRTTASTFNAPRRGAPKEQIDACINGAKDVGMQNLVWGVVYILMTAVGGVTVVWGRSYRKRCLEIREFQKLQDKLALGGKEEKEDEKASLGLVLGKSVKTKSHGTIGPTKAETGISIRSKHSSTSASPVSPMTITPRGSSNQLNVNYAHSSVSTMVTNTGIIPVMHQPGTPQGRPQSYSVPPLKMAVRHSEMYRNPLPELVVGQGLEKGPRYSSRTSSRYSQDTIGRVL